MLVQIKTYSALNKDYFGITFGSDLMCNKILKVINSLCEDKTFNLKYMVKVRLNWILTGYFLFEKEALIGL